eukprot:1161646-Pelagomonas_calceolata.AAC.32
MMGKIQVHVFRHWFLEAIAPVGPPATLHASPFFMQESVPYLVDHTKDHWKEGLSQPFDTSELSSRLSVDIYTSLVWFGYRHLLLQLSCPCRQGKAQFRINALKPNVRRRVRASRSMANNPQNPLLLCFGRPPRLALSDLGFWHGSDLWRSTVASH